VLIVLIIGLAVADCAAVKTPIYEDATLTVRLEPNPGGDSAQNRNDAQAITTQQLATILRGFYIRKKTGVVQSIIGGLPESVFREDELPLVAGQLQKGLKQASPQERVVFQLWMPRGPGREEITGACYLRGSLFHLSLAKFRSADLVSYKGEYGSGPEIDLFYEPSGAIVQKQQGAAARWLGAEKPEVIIDMRRVPGIAQTLESTASATSGPSFSTPKAKAADILERQMQELFESNRKLEDRARQAQADGNAAKEELEKLRQELNETKQLLAETVLELNRLKNRSVKPQ
jgi:hypothetical protein